MSGAEYEVCCVRGKKLCVEHERGFALRTQKVEGGTRYTLCYTPDGEVTFKYARLSIPFEFTDDDYFLANGFQAWSLTREYRICEKERGIIWLAKTLSPIFKFKTYGDYMFYTYTNTVGRLHSHTYTYIRRGDRFSFFGSLSERNGYVYFETEPERGRMSAYVDVKDLVWEKKRTLFDIVVMDGSENEVFDQYFALLGVTPPTAKHVTGFTTWYNYYRKIDEAVIDKNLAAMDSIGNPADVFQIDDGYQSAVGDWLSVDRKKFKGDFKALISRIKKNHMAGLWLAPLICERRSRLFKEHRDWLAKNRRGKPVFVGMNWGGYYALDIYNEQVREYLRHVFDVILNDWGVDLVKLDFLYAAALAAPAGKTRGEVMCDTMDFLREAVGDKLILGCGVPLGASFGKVDYCRIGCDVGLGWDENKFVQNALREMVSIKHTITDTIYRRQLDGRAFLNDPDVFHLRDDVRMKPNEKEILRVVNALFGSVLFTSDDVSGYKDSSAFAKLYDTFDLAKAKVEQVIMKGAHTASVLFCLDGETRMVLINADDVSHDIDGSVVNARDVLFV